MADWLGTRVVQFEAKEESSCKSFMCEKDLDVYEIKYVFFSLGYPGLGPDKREHPTLSVQASSEHGTLKKPCAHSYGTALGLEEMIKL